MIHSVDAIRLDARVTPSASRDRSRISLIGPLSLEDRCSTLFREHRIEASDGAFHVPNPESNPIFFTWDSGNHAWSLLHLDPEAALDELATLYRATGAQAPSTAARDITVARLPPEGHSLPWRTQATEAHVVATSSSSPGDVRKPSVRRAK
jgi:hypothetical protein